MSSNDKWIPMPRFLLRKSALKKIIKNLNLKDKKCLEIGYGAGETLKLLVQKGAIVDGFDFSEDARSLAKTRLQHVDYSENIKLFDDEREVKENQYDIIFAFEVLEHIGDDEQELKQWDKYLKSQGQIILSVPAHMSKWSVSDVWAGHFRRYEKKELQDLLENSNFKVVSLWNYGFPLSNLLDKFLGSQKKKELQNIDGELDIAEQSKKSGIDRKNTLLYKILFNDFMLFPFYLLQKLFFTKDVGSGYIVHAKKADED